MAPELLCVRDGGVLRLTLNRPEKRNALSSSLLAHLVAELDAARQDTTVRAIVLTGAGRVFSAGGDLDQMSANAPGGTPSTTLVDLFLAMRRLGKPTVAMVNGHALAGGLGL